MTENLLTKFRDKFFARWIACRVISDKKSVQYGLYFSSPIYLLLVITGILLVDPFILLGAALIAFLGIKLPLHPFDYVYNFVIAKLIGTSKIPGRGSELQVNSIISLIFNLIVLFLISFSVSINFGVLAVIYGLSSIFFMAIILFKD